MTENDPLIGKKLGDYVIQGLLGQGGMARVYRGYDAHLDRYSAVKVITPAAIPGDDEEEYRERFQREARAIARLSHPGIVNIFQFGQMENMYYMAMNFVDGRDLRQVLKDYNKRGKLLSDQQVLQIVGDVASALDYAHDQGVIHRDVKPSNIMITGEGRAVLTDFGLALNAQEGTIGNTFGSVHYIAPEQAVSSAQAVAQSDLYSLGVVLFEMLTGRVPFEDASAMSVALKHISDPPPLPSHINPDITSEIEAVIIRLLDKDPTRRFPSGAVLLDALQTAYTSRKDDTAALAASKPAPPPPAPSGLVRSSDMDDLPTISDSSRNRPGSLPFSPIEDAKSAETSPNKENKRGGLLVGAGVIIALVVLVGAAFASGLLGGADDADSAATETAVALVALAEDETATSEAATEQAAEITEEATEEPTDAPTDTPEPTDAPTDTQEPTDTPTDAATEIAAIITAAAETTAEVTAESTAEAETTEEPEDNDRPEDWPPIDAEDEDDPQVLLRYDGRTLVLYNRSNPPATIDLTGVSFTRISSTGTEMTYRANEWDAADLWGVAAGECLQVWTVRFLELPMTDFPADICDARPAFRQTVRPFWTSSRDGFIFEVRRGEDVLATCPVAETESEDELRCLVELRAESGEDEAE